MTTPRDLIFLSILGNRVDEARLLADECNSLIIPSLETSLELLKDWEGKGNITHDDANYFAGELVDSARQYRRDCIFGIKQRSSL